MSSQVAGMEINLVNTTERFEIQCKMQADLNSRLVRLANRLGCLSVPAAAPDKPPTPDGSFISNFAHYVTQFEMQNNQYLGLVEALDRFCAYDSTNSPTLASPPRQGNPLR